MRYRVTEDMFDQLVKLLGILKIKGTIDHRDLAMKTVHVDVVFADEFTVWTDHPDGGQFRLQFPLEKESMIVLERRHDAVP